MACFDRAGRLGTLGSKAEKMKARFSNISFGLPIFDYLNEEQKAVIRDRMEKGISICVSFEENDYTKFCAVLDIDEADSLHVREVAGNFLKEWRVLDLFCEGLARAIKKPAITYNTFRNAVMRVSGIAGYEPSGEHEFKRVIAA